MQLGEISSSSLIWVTNISQLITYLLITVVHAMPKFFIILSSLIFSLISSEFCAILWKSSPLWVKMNFPRVYPDTIQFSSVTQLCLTLHDPLDCSMPGLLVHHQLPEFTQTHVHWVGEANSPSHPLPSPSPPAFNLSHHQGLLKWLSSLHQVAKVLEFQLQHQSYQWTFRIDFL